MHMVPDRHKLHIIHDSLEKIKDIISGGIQCFEASLLLKENINSVKDSFYRNSREDSKFKVN